MNGYECSYGGSKGKMEKKNKRSEEAIGAQRANCVIGMTYMHEYKHTSGWTVKVKRKPR